MVMTDTATAMGYMKPSRIPRLTPRDAMMKENSPICAKLKPPSTEFFRFCPDISIPMVPKIGCPMTVTKNIIRIGSQYFTIMSGSTIIPTDTKKMAPNMSLIPLVRCSTLST